MKDRVRAVAVAWLVVGWARAEAEEQPPRYVAAPGYGVMAEAQGMSGGRLLTLSAAELEALYRSAPPGPQPRGKVRGLPIVSPGKATGPALSKAARVVWQGKVFRDDGATAVNRFFGVRAIEGNLSYGPSWLDGAPALILDYQGTSFVYGRYRDEIRQVGPNLYLGLMYARTKAGPPEFTRYFAFETRP